MAEAAGHILDRCRELGFALAGVASAESSRWGAELASWLAAGKHGTMSWLGANVEARLDPAKVLPGARSAILVADLYAPRGAPESAPAPGHGRIARYARGRDYHAVMKKRLHALADALREMHPGAEFRAFTDTAPVMERELAQRAGLGWIGKHTLLIHPRLGSYFFLGGLLTTLDLAPGPPAAAQKTPTVRESPPSPPAPAMIPDHCGTCTRCIDACPTRAITPHSVDASRCISYLTIEHRGPIAPEFHEPIGDRLFGCDICQEVCPHNSARGIGFPADASAASADSSGMPARDDGPLPPPHRAYAPLRDSFPLLEILSWMEDDRRAAFRSSALKRATLAMMKRNAIIVAGNRLHRRDDPALRARLEHLAADPAEPDLVRTTARTVLDHLNRPPAANLAAEQPRKGAGT